MKKVLGLDLGTTSIGWAFVHEKESGTQEESSIQKIGVRVNPLSTETRNDFEKGKAVSINADRTLARGARRGSQRYKQRRERLISILTQHGLISADTILAENDKDSTHSTYAVRSKAAAEKVSLEDLSRILLMINKKRGYKSSRKVNNEDEGQLIDGMSIAKRLYEEKLTPGELSYQLLLEGKKQLPDFYRSDLEQEFQKVWNKQFCYYPDILTEEFKARVLKRGKPETTKLFLDVFRIYTAQNKGKDKKAEAYRWRSQSIHVQLPIEEVAFVIAEINGNIAGSSGYLGAISDRSKELYFNKETIGQYLYRQLIADQHTRLKNQVFYRQDYFDEFEIVWQKQVVFYPVLTVELKNEIRDLIIFYQRKLKSQKGQVSFCELESKTVQIDVAGIVKSKTIGSRVIPKSSPLFQEFKIFQNLGSVLITVKNTGEKLPLCQEKKIALFNELNIKGNLTKAGVLKLLNYKDSDHDINFSVLEGNRTNQEFYAAYLKMMEFEGHDDLDESKLSAGEKKAAVKSFFNLQKINPLILEFDGEMEEPGFQKQLSFQLWHLLYSYEGDDSTTGNDMLYKILNEKFGFKKELAIILAKVSFQQEYGSLSSKAIKKIFPFIKENVYSAACASAGYNHSSYLTKEQNEKRELHDKLEILPKNSLRNPVVEKILNQMVNVINAIIADPELGKPDEIRVELARDLKKNAKEREKATNDINKSKSNNDATAQILINEFGIKNPSRNDIIRFKLYEELKPIGYKDLYTNQYISREELFSKKYDVDHIIPQALLFDDSFSNKTLAPRHANSTKDKRTAFDYISNDFGPEKTEEYLLRIEELYKTRDGSIGKAKYLKLKMAGSDIGKGFIDRDLRDSQYIAKKATAMLMEVCRNVVTTTGTITARLREDWDLINVMQELNLDKYKKIGLTELIEKKDGSFKERIVDWTKRNDHRHHAMDALTIAFTQRSHIQYLNNLNAKAYDDKKGRDIIGIEQKITEQSKTGKRLFTPPMPNFREKAKDHLENVLVSIKAKNKVATKNKNKTKSESADKIKVQLTPRGQLHKETIYSRIKVLNFAEVKIDGKLDEATIQKILRKDERMVLLKRLHSFDSDPKKAFAGKNSLEKNPVYLDIEKTLVLEGKVKIGWYEDTFTIRKNITPDLKLEKVVDTGIRDLLTNRLASFKGNAKDAFGDLEKNPIWFNKEKGISIKTVSITGVKTALPLHVKKDHFGNNILDSSGSAVSNDFVSTGNNHHSALYLDQNGDLQDEVVSFHQVVTERLNKGLSIINKDYNNHLGWKFQFSIKQNEMFVFPSANFDPSQIDLLDPVNYKIISPNLFRVQKFSKNIVSGSYQRHYFFRHHLETSVDVVKSELKDLTFKLIGNVGNFKGIIKVRINHVGKVVEVGEY